MGIGILDDPRTPFPPGTCILTEKLTVGAGLDESELDGFKKDGDVVLQPQPSDSPNDPYNWSERRKYGMAILLIANAITIGGTQGMLHTGMRILAEKYHTTFPNVIRHLTPPRIVSHAFGLSFASAMAAVYGKRVLYVTGVFVIWAEMFAGWFANSLDYYTALSAIGGFASSFEILNGPIMTEMVYVHKRGRIMGLTAIVAVVGGDASQVISGNVISKLGIKYTYLISCCIVALLAALIYLFVWETTYYRKTREVKRKGDLSPGAISENFETDSKSQSDVKPDVKKDISVTQIENLSPISSHPEDFAIPEAKFTWKQQLKVFRGRITKRSLLQAFYQPFPLLLFPSVLFATFVNGAFMTWLQISGLLKFQVLAYPPYNLKPDQLAYINLPGSIINLLTSIFSGLFSDWLIKFLSRRNKGVYEPEFRLLLMLPATIFSTVSFLLLGNAYHYKWSIVRIVACSICMNIAVPFAGNASMTYIYDTQRTTATEAVVASALVKSIFGYFVTSYVPAWFEKAGPLKAFTTLAILNVSFACLTIPVYIFGKRLRGMVARNKFLMKAAIHKED
ncbi:MFS general substrate transporter [Microthyrium microscopicum]|uniref:MFS general substrate transporter n=1 Tax=Microthyrium microscopicum TaxID=703497 RepID=A0A6A6U0J6_9PEZI|nr:MFS general substrate transporter [Microthyrium microscopicum]